MPSRWSRADDVPRGDAYDERFSRLAAAGVDVHGEATFVEQFGPRRVLDAGCGTGRVAIELDRRGVEVVGVDLDPVMLDRARRLAPQLRWELGDLARLELHDLDPDGPAGPAAEAPPARFDVVVAAGNVLIFVDPGTEAEVVARLAAHLAPGGVLVCGFQLRPGGYTSEQFDDHATAAGLVAVARYATWEREPFRPDGDYVVTVDRRPA